MSWLTDLRPSRGNAVDAVFAGALTTLGVYAFKQSYGGIEFLVLGVVGAGLGVSVAFIGNHRRHPALLVIAELLVTYVVVGGTVALRRDAVAGVLPSPRTLLGALNAIVGGWKQLLTTVPPVGRVGNLLALPMFCGIVGAGGAVLWSHRIRALLPAVVVPTAVMTLGLLCGLNKPVSVTLHGAVFAAVVVVWAAIRHRRVQRVVHQSTHDRRRRLIGAAALVAVASAVGLVLGPNLPFAQANDRVILRDTLEPPFDPLQFPSPLSGYRNYVKSDKTHVLFTVSGLPKDVPIRMATMDDYDGVVWRVTGGKAASASGYFERVGSDVAPQYPGRRAKITIEIKEWSEVWIPTVGEVVGIRFAGPRARQLADAFRYNRATDTAASQTRLLRPGDSYELDVVLPPAASDAKGGTLIDVRGRSSSNAVPEELVSWAAPLVQKVERSQRPSTLANALSDRGVYSDGVAGQERSLGGHNAKRMQDFIAADQPVGDAEQFAAALGLMLRGDDISARVVVGFKPAAGSAGRIEIRGADAEAWVEVPINGVGWVPLFPTPPRTRVKLEDKPKPRPQPERNTQVPPPPPVLVEDPRSEPAKEAAGTKDDKKTPKAAAPVGGKGLSRSVILGTAIGGPPLLLIGGTSGVILFLKARRRRRRQTRGSATERISNGWRELLDVARDLGRPVPENATRRELAGFVGTSTAPELAYGADVAVFGPGDTPDVEVRSYWDRLSDSIHELRHQVGFIDRLKARLSLTSLRRVKAQ